MKMPKRYSMRSKTRQHKASSTALSDLWPHGMLVNTCIKTVHMCYSFPYESLLFQLPILS